MKVLVLSATFPPMRSGGSEYAFRLCQHLAEAGAEVCALTSRIENAATDPRFEVRPAMESWSWSELPALLRIARRFRPDVVNLHFQSDIYGDHPMVTFAPTVLKQLLPGVRFVTLIESPGGVRLPRTSRLTQTVRRLFVHWAGPREVDDGYGTILRDSDRIIVLSDTHRHALARRLARADAKCVLIPPPPLMRMCPEDGGAARARGRAALGVDGDACLLAYYGYIYPTKGIETLLEAFAAAARRHRRADLRLVIVGGSNEVLLRTFDRPDYVRELKELAEQLGVAEAVTWSGYYPTDCDQASQYLRAADLCVLPFDGGLYLNNSSFAAAAAHGLPIISTAGEVVEAQLVDRHNVMLCPPKNPEALAAAIESLLADSGLRRRLHEGSLDLAREWFSWDSVIKSTIEAFGADGGEVAAPPSPPPAAGDFTAVL